MWIALCGMQLIHGMKPSKPERDTEEVKANKKVMKDQRAYLEQNALIFSYIFASDEAETKRVFRTLMASPSAHVAGSDRMIDKRLLLSLKKNG